MTDLTFENDRTFCAGILIGITIAEFDTDNFFFCLFMSSYNKFPLLGGPPV